MCLTIPGKIKSIKDGKAVVENGARSEQIDMGIILDAKVGDWVLYATDRAVRLIDESDAREIIALLEDKYHPVDIAALPLRYKKIIYKIRNPKLQTLNPKQIQNPKSKISNSNETMKHWNNDVSLSKSDLEYLLNLKGSNNLEALYSEANVMRKDKLEDFVCIHGIVEFSNNCRNNCLYCGIRRDANIQRYRMTVDEIYQAVKIAVENEGYKLVVLQSGEDFSYSDEEMIEMIKKIKKDIRVFVFISVGERSRDFYERAFEAGATGSLLRFETSNPKLYEKMHPGHNLKERLQCLQDQIDIGYFVASGAIIGLPGQTVADMAQDLLLVKKLGVPMLSSGPFMPSGGTPLGNPKSQTLNPKPSFVKTTEGRQIQNSNFKTQNDVIARNEAIFNNKEIATSRRSISALAMTDEDKLRLTLNYYAAARLLMPEIKIPVTTALETLDPESGRHKGLLAGANALMFNITPEKYRADYNLYDHKYIEREKVWQKYGLFKGEESYEMLEERLQI